MYHNRSCMPSLPLNVRLGTLALAVSAALPVMAQQQAQPIKGEAPVARIAVTGQMLSDADQRRDQTAAKIIVGHEELVKYGDNTLSEALKRLPGITVGGAPGRGGDLRMRGLGNGYTQLLLNGEAPARGFPLDSISPDMVDRVEIIPASSAEYSAQGIAGTINLILKTRRPKAQNEAKAGVSVDRGRLTPSVSAQYSDAFGGGSYTLAAFANRYDQLTDSRALIATRHGAATQVEDAATSGSRHGVVAGLNPRILFNLGGGDTLNVLPFWFHRDGRDGASTDSTYLVPSPVLPLLALQGGDSRADSLRTTATWTHRLESAGKIEWKAGFNVNQSRTDTRLRQSGSLGQLLDRSDSDDVDDNGWTLGVKWLAASMGDHALVMGAEAEDSRRTQDSTVRYFGTLGPAASVDATIRRYSAFVQDEWKLSPAWSANAGLRWERLNTMAGVAGGASAGASHDIFSPSLHLVWKLSEQRRDQLRGSLSRSYKAPQIGDLTPWTVLSSRNAPTAPDRAGNPLLAPETANGLDLAYERYVGKNGVLGASAFVRRIGHLIRREVTLADGRWLSVPRNLEGARTAGVTLEAKVRLQELDAALPGVDLRANVSRYWSNVDGIAGPGNTLDEQPRYTANLGADYSLRTLPLTVGGNLNWTPAYDVQTSPWQNKGYGIKRGYDLYAQWRFGAAATLRVSATNISHSDYLTADRIAIGGDSEQRTVDTRTSTSVGALLSVRF